MALLDYGDFLRGDESAEDNHMSEIEPRAGNNVDMIPRGLSKYLDENDNPYSIGHVESGNGQDVMMPRDLARLLDEDQFEEASVMEIGNRGFGRLLEDGGTVADTGLERYLVPNAGDHVALPTAAHGHVPKHIEENASPSLDGSKDPSPSANIDLTGMASRPGSTLVKRTSLTSSIQKRNSPNVSSALSLNEGGPNTRGSKKKSMQNSPRSSDDGHDLSGKTSPIGGTPGQTPRKSPDDSDADGESMGGLGAMSISKDKQSTEEKRRRRAESNRLSAERSRERKKKYMKELEAGMRMMQSQNNELKKALGFYRQQISVLQEVIRLHGDQDQKLAANAVESAIRQYQSQVPQGAATFHIGKMFSNGIGV